MSLSSSIILLFYFCSFSLQRITRQSVLINLLSFHYRSWSICTSRYFHLPAWTRRRIRSRQLPRTHSSSCLPGSFRIGSWSTGPWSGRHRSYVQYIHVLTIVDFIKANELSKKSRILQTCRRKTDVGTLQMESRHAISPRQGIGFVRCHRIAGTRASQRDRHPRRSSVKPERDIRTSRRHPLPSQRSCASTWTRANTPNPPPKFRRQDRNPRNGSPHELLG